MDSSLIVGLVVLLALAALAFLIVRRRKSDQLRKDFGPEYDRAVKQTGDPQKAEAELLQRKKRIDSLELRSLSPDERTRYSGAWRQVQAEFVDDPKGSIGQADDLIGSIMEALGYPVGDFEQRSADLSVEHPLVVQNYRAAHSIALRHRRGEAGTEELRQAMIHYRDLFDELVHQTDGSKAGSDIHQARRESSNDPRR